MLKKLDCFFVGDRTYIQGSQIIQKVCENLTETNPASKIFLTEAKFTSISDNEIFMSDAQEPSLEKIGFIEFTINETCKLIHIYTNTNRIEKRVEDAPGFKFNFESQDQLNGELKFSTSESSFQLLLCTIIAANKKLHNDLSDSTHDIWFTGIRKAQLNTLDNANAKEGKIILKHMMTVGKSTHQTISEVTIASSSSSTSFNSFIISFAYKS